MSPLRKIRLLKKKPKPDRIISKHIGATKKKIIKNLTKK